MPMTGGVRSSRLEPLAEEPSIAATTTTTNNNGFDGGPTNSRSLQQQNNKRWGRIRWLKNHFSDLTTIFNINNNKNSDHRRLQHLLKILLSVLGCPLFPIPISTLDPNNNSIISPKVSSSAQYIIQHFTAATGCRKLEGTVKNMYVTGKVTMNMVEEISSNNNPVDKVNCEPQKGCFVMWQMVPNMWLIELVVSGHKVIAGSNGNVAWRHTPWLGVHAALGGVRPLRRALQGLDPVAVSTVFSLAQYVGEKEIVGVDCFILKLSSNPTDLASRSDNTAEMIKHAMFGYFSQKSGLLVYLEDSYLTRMQSPGCHPTYWETTMSTNMEDYRMVEGVMIAHSGKSTATISRFGENVKAGTAITRMEEVWSIDDMAFNVPGLSVDCFIPPKEVEKKDRVDESLSR